jgi:hypothetical protein
MPQKGQVTFSKSSDGARSPVALRAFEVGMRLNSLQRPAKKAWDGLQDNSTFAKTDLPARSIA